MVEHSHSVSTAAAAIVGLINSSPRSPRQEEIEAIIAKVAPAEAPALHVSELGRKLRADLARFDAWLGKDVSDADWDDVWGSDWNEIYRLEAQIPNPPRSFADVVARAELAYFGADKGPDNRTMDLEEGDCWEGPAARLIEAVLQFAGSDIATEGRRHG